MKKSGKAGKLAAVLLWLCLWQVAAICTDNQILLVGPVQVILRLLQDILEVSFWQTVLTSTFRILLGFLGAFVLGSLFGVLAYRFRWFRILLEPLMSAVKSVPVASFAVILLIWFGASGLSIWISFLITFPNLYFQVLEGMGSTDRKLLELAKLYDMPVWNQAWYLYRPALAPFFRSGCNISIGMAWKSGVAAEVIGLPEFSIGERIYMSKIYLDTAGVLSWTIVCVLLSVVVEKVFLLLLDRMLTGKVPMLPIRDSVRMGKDKAEEFQLVIKALCKSYGDKVILKNWSEHFQSGNIYAFMEPSGRGKTTLFRILGGLEQADSGCICMDGVKGQQCIDGLCSMAFQENRFFPNLTAAENLQLVCRGRGQNWNGILQELLPEDALLKPMSQFSGGMARRVEIIRCMLSEGELLLLDEPFNGLDEAAKVKTAALIRRYQGQRIIFVATHSEEDAALLGAEKASLGGKE